jgi:hypothetical protein
MGFCPDTLGINARDCRESHPRSGIGTRIVADDSTAFGEVSREGYSS